MVREDHLIQELDSTNINALTCNIEDLSNYLPPGSPNLSIITQNIRSIHKNSNIDDLEINLDLLEKNIDVLVLTECRIDPKKPLPNKPNYVIHNTTLKVNQNDGVVIFIKNSIEHSVKEINLSGASCLEISIFTYSIICIYRSPSEKNPDNFIKSLETHLNSPHLKNKNIIILGDININIIEGNCDNYGSIYLDMLAEHNLLPGHRFDTRINSCLDHIITNLNPTKFSATIAVLNTTITDHKMVSIHIYDNKKIYKAPKTKTIINYSEALNTLKDKNINENLITIEDPDSLTYELITKINDSLNENTTVIKIPNSKRIIKPWITPGILKCIKNRNKLQKQLSIDSSNDILRITYRRYRNFCNNLIKKLKYKYESDLLDKSKTNNKTLWNCIKNITNLKKQKTINKELINLKHNPTDSAEHVNRYFNSIGKKLAEDTSMDPNIIDDYFTMLPSLPNSIGIIEPEPAEIAAIIVGLKSESAAGWDNISTKFLKMSINEVIPILTRLSILVFQQGIFPQLLKRSIIHPIYKSGDRDDISNYRPISVLPVISKIMEKLINNRIINYLNAFNILSNSQYGFRQGKSTEDAILELTKNITNSIDNKRKTLCIFLDLKKAFDTVSVPILLRKLEKVGIRGSFFNLIADYLNNRSQRVKLDQNTFSSDLLSTGYGVPQGSVLGPTLFLIYINDLTDLKLANGQVISYADDTALLFQDIDWPRVFDKAERGLRVVNTWLNTNSLALNTSKTNYITFSIYDSMQPDAHLTLTSHNCLYNPNQQCSCPKIERVASTKYLGVIIDRNLSWYPQLDAVANRARKLIWLFKYLRKISDKQLITYIYTTLVQSILLYCIVIWGGTFKTNFISIERAQRTILKVMLKKNRRYRTAHLYHDADVLTVRKLYILQCLLITHKNTTIDLNILQKRNAYSVIKPKTVRTNFASKQFSAQSVNLYNKVNRILNIYSLTYRECKRTLTIWLKSLTYEEIENLLS